MLNKKIAVLLWLYHNDLDKEFFDLLYPVQQYVDIHLALCEDNENSDTINLFNRMNNIKQITFMPNCGADILPFINQLQSISADNYEYFFKIHSKKSFWGENDVGDWRVMLLDNLIGSKKALLDNINYINKTKKGMYGCNSLLYNQNDLPSNLHNNQINYLTELLNLNEFTSVFFAGTMFAGNTSLYKQYLNSETVDKLTQLLSQEKGKIEETPTGTYSHAMERVLGYIGASQEVGYLNQEYICIKISDPVVKQTYPYLDFNIMYNNDIYCVLQSSLYGSVIERSDKTLRIHWKQNGTTIEYSKIRDNIYVNSLHTGAGV